MTEFNKSTMAMIIIGDEENKLFDGKIKANGKNEGIKYHCDCLKKIVKELDIEGYSLDGMNYSSFHESGFMLVNNGHILFCNCTIGNNTLAYLFIPPKLTEKQIESLKLFESDFQQFEEFYIMKIDELDKENFQSSLSCNNFDVNELLDNYYKKKTK